MTIINQSHLAAIENLRQGLAHHDKFGAQPDGSPIFVCPDNTLYEFPHDNGQFSLGDLRLVLEAAQENAP